MTETAAAPEGASLREGAVAGGGSAAIVAEKLSRGYGDREVLRDVSFRLEADRTLAVLGANGTGKSTLVRLLSTLLRPHAGRLEVLGAPLPDQAWRARGRVGLVAQDPLLYRDLTGRENLRYAAELHGLQPAATGERIEWLLDQVGMRRRADDPIGQLSRGMAQRLAVCRAVLHEPELLLLDEPVSALDPHGTALVEPLLAARPGRARVLVSHEPERALAEADAVLALDPRGRVAHHGPAAGFDPGDADELYRAGGVVR